MTSEHCRNAFEDQNGWRHGNTSRYGYDIRRRDTDDDEGTAGSANNGIGRALLKRVLLAAIIVGLTVAAVIGVYLLVHLMDIDFALLGR